MLAEMSVPLHSSRQLQRLKADKLSVFDDVLTDLLVDSVCCWASNQIRF